MQHLTPQHKKKIEKMAKIIGGGNIAIAKHLLEIEDKIDAEIPSMRDIISRMKGDKGDDAVTPTKEDLLSLIKPLIPQVKDGVDYVLTEKDKKEIAKSIKVPVVEKIIKTERIIKEQPIIKETVVKEAIALHTSPQEVRDLIELLMDDERLDASAIKNLEIAFKAYLTLNPPNGPMLHPVALGNLPDVSVVGATIGQALLWNGTYWYAGTVSGGGGFTELVATGTVDGINAVFTFTQVPSYIVSDGAWYKKLDNNSNVQWSSSGMTITMTIPPQTAIFGIA